MWAEPVTGSSLTPAPGKKHLEIKSYSLDWAETINPLVVISDNISKLGLMSWISNSLSKIAKISSLPLKSSFGFMPTTFSISSKSS